MNAKICIHCRKSYKPNPRVKNQQYCREKACQRARRRSWQREKMVKDPAYKENQRRCWQNWYDENHSYMKEYRANNPGYVDRNVQLQSIRDLKKRKDKTSKILVKMDSLAKKFYSRRGGYFKVIGYGVRNLVKMDSLIVKLIPLPMRE